MCSGWPEHWLHTLSPPGISHTRLVSSLLGTAPLDPALCPAGASQVLVLHGRGRRESLTRPFLNHKNHQAKSFACSGDQIRPWSPVENPQLQVLSFGEVLTAAAVMSRHLQLTEGQGQRGQERMEVSVCSKVPESLMRSWSFSLSLKTLRRGDPLISPRCFYAGLVFHYH